MEVNEIKEDRRHVIEKIRRISIAVDRRESLTMILLTGLFAGTFAGLAYYLFL